MEKQTDPNTGTTLFISMLGGFRLSRCGQVLAEDSNRAQKTWNVLAYLIINRSRSIPQMELIETFWPEAESANPTSALKTLFFRLRGLLEPLFPDGVQPILSQRGAYAWNKDVACDVDIDRFNALYEHSREEGLSKEERMACLEQLTALYQGEFLPLQSGSIWVISLSTSLHNRYIAAVKTYAALLEENGNFERMLTVSAAASKLDTLDEELHILIVRALIAQNDHAAALEHYQMACDLLYRELGISPSEALKSLYAVIMDSEETLETDLGVIQENLRETTARPGAFLCDYGFFREIYRLEARRAARSGTCIHTALLTVSCQRSGEQVQNLLNRAMELLQGVLTGSLRRGDVVSRYSPTQYVVMLPSANFEDATMVVERIVAAFYRSCSPTLFRLTYRVRELEIS